jgi:Dynamin GTPase effector domain
MTPLTNGMSFLGLSCIDTHNQSRQERLQIQLLAKTLSDCQHGNVVRLEDIVQHHPLSNDDHIIREIHDILRSYYKLTRKRFVDNVRMQAADYFLVTGPETPLKLFSPKFVAELTTTQLENVAGEELGTKRRRAKLEKEIELLKKGIEILQ